MSESSTEVGGENKISRRAFLRKSAQVIAGLGISSILLQAGGMKDQEAQGFFDFPDAIKEQTVNFIENFQVSNQLPDFSLTGRWVLGLTASSDKKHIKGATISVQRPLFDEKDRRFFCPSEVKKGYTLMISTDHKEVVINRLHNIAKPFGTISPGASRQMLRFKEEQSGDRSGRLAQDLVTYYYDAFSDTVSVVFTGGIVDREDYVDFRNQAAIDCTIDKKKQTIVFRHWWVDYRSMSYHSEYPLIVCYEYRPELTGSFQRPSYTLLQKAYRIKMRLLDKKIESIHDISSSLAERKQIRGDYYQIMGSGSVDEMSKLLKLRRKFESDGQRVDMSDPQYNVLSQSVLRYFERAPRIKT